MFAMFGDLVEAVAAWRDTDLVAGLLLGIFLVTLGIGISCLLLVVNALRRARLGPRRRSEHGPAPLPKVRPTSASFALPSRWLAIKSSQPFRVQEALRLSKPTPCSWAEGLANAQEKKLFISPPVAGWVLVLGSGLPDPAEDVDRCYCLLLELSRKLGHVQFFSFNRSLNHHAWAQASHGEILRAYAWAGQTLWNQGAITRAESDLQVECFDYAEALPQTSTPNPLPLNTEKVPLLAERWSIDPATIDPRHFRESHGIAGQLSWRKSG